MLTITSVQRRRARRTHADEFVTANGTASGRWLVTAVNGLSTEYPGRPRRVSSKALSILFVLVLRSTNDPDVLVQRATRPNNSK